MEVKELRDLIKVIHDSGDCGHTLSDVLEMANKICEQPSDLEIVQKALDQSKLADHRCASLDFCGYGDWIVWQYSESAAHQFASGNGHESLLTWAKQTIGG